MSDEADISSDAEIDSNQRALHNHRMRYQPAPEYNGNGEKICIECGIDIPTQRAAIADTVRCIDCQIIEEKTR